MKVKKVVAFFLASTMVLSMIPAMAFAADKSDSNVEGLDFAKALSDGTYKYGKPGEGYDWVTADCYEVKEVQYCTDPVSELQYMNIWVPAEYVNDDGSINTEAVVNGYTAETAPIIFRNNCSGWMSSDPENMGENKIGLNDYMENGFIYVSCGARSRDLDKSIGKAPAPIVDLKAGIRYLKANDKAIPGDSEKIISVGGSGGGQMSSLVGATGNMDEYYSYLYEIGAAGISKDGDTYSSSIKDDVYGCMAYYPISDLENADIAYAWMWEDTLEDGGNQYEEMWSPGKHTLTPFQERLQTLEAEAFVAYINSLGLKDASGNSLTLEGLREGSYYNAILQNLSEALNAMVKSQGLDPEKEYENCAEWITENSDGTYQVTDLLGFMKGTGLINNRNKNVPGFDTMDEKAENDAFGTSEQETSHYSASVAKVLQDNLDELRTLEGYNEEQVSAYIQDTLEEPGASFIENQTYLMNATEIMLDKANGTQNADIASHWRIRSGTADQHTSFTVGYNMSLAVEANGVPCDYSLVWDMPHGGELEGTSTGTFVEWVKEIAPGTDQKPSDDTVNADDYLDYSAGVEKGLYTWVKSQDGSYYFLAAADEDGNAVYTESAGRDGSISKNYQGVYMSAEITNVKNQTMLIYIPAEYLKTDAEGNVTGINRNGKIGNYTAATAPIVYENNCSGWMSSTPKACNTDYIKEGMIYVSAGARSRDAMDETGTLHTGKTPTPVVDLKAGIIELRANTDILPGNTEKIYSVGTSGGGQMSSILGASGNMSEYYPYMYEAGVLGVTKNEDGTYSSQYRDDVYGAQCYCPIADLENADLAYAWMWYDSVNIGGDKYTEMGQQEQGQLTPFQRELQNLEAEAFVKYINSLNLKDENGNSLTLEGLREGSYYDAVLQNMSDALNALVKEGGIDPEKKYPDSGYWLKKNEDGTYAVTNMKGFMLGTGLVNNRNKNVPGFDTFDKSAENNAFGTPEQDAMHYSASVAQVLKDNYQILSACEGFDKTTVDQYIEEALTGKDAAYIDEQTDLMNATHILLGTDGLNAVDPAKRWRTRNGTADQHTSFTIAYNLCLAARSQGLDTDYSLVWDMGHGSNEGTSTGTFIDWIKADTESGGNTDIDEPEDSGKTPADPSDSAKDPGKAGSSSEDNVNGGMVNTNASNNAVSDADGSGTPKTEDGANAALPLGCLIAAGCAVILTAAVRKKTAR